MTVASNKKNGGFFFISLLTDVGGFYDTGDGSEEKKRKYGSIVTDKFMDKSLKTYSLFEEANMATLSAEGNSDIFFAVFHFLFHYDNDDGVS